MRRVIAVSLLLAAAAVSPAVAADCPGNPNALGVSRVLVVDPTEHPLLGELGYHESLPLNDHEVVLTFDDGPLPPYTGRILDILKHECVKAVFFEVGRMARGYPHMVKRVFEEGHTLANHSETHPFTFHKMPVDNAVREIQGGFNSIRTALGDPNGVAPFFRFPGLLHQPPVERYLKSQGVQAWSVDVVADDWTHINNHEVVRRAISRLEARGKGILLLHDIQPATALGLADLLAELKAHNFKVVQVVPATADRPKTPTTPDQWVIHHRHEPPSIWPEPAIASLAPSTEELEAPSPASFGVTDTPGALVPVAVGPGPEDDNGRAGEVPLPPVATWPRTIAPAAPAEEVAVLPAPAQENFRYSRVWRPHMVTRNAGRVASVSHKSGSRKTAARKTASPEDITNSVPSSSRSGPSEKPGVKSRNAKSKRTRTAERTRELGHELELPRSTASSQPPSQKPKGLIDQLFR